MDWFFDPGSGHHHHEEGDHVEGYNIGLYVPRRGSTVIDGGYFNNVSNIYITTGVRDDLSVLITGGIQFGTLSESALQDRTQYRVEMKADFVRLIGFAATQTTVHGG